MQYTREDIFHHTKELMVKLFEVDEDKFHMGAKLYADLDIDSIDAVDLMIELKNLTGVKISQEDFREISTISDVIDIVYRTTRSA